MADPIFLTTDITIIDSADATTNWSQVGQMGPVLDNDFFVQGTGAVGVEFKNSTPTTGTQATCRFNNQGTIDCTGKHIRIWAFIATSKSIADEANFGLAVRVYDSGGSNWGDWVVAGSDFGNADGWKLYVIDVDSAFTRDSGTAPAKTALQYFGMNAQVTNTLSKANGLVVDRIMISATADSSDVTGGYMEVQSPSHTGSSDLDFNDNGAGADTIVRPSGSFLTDGFESGDTIVVSNTTNNNGELAVVTAAALTLTLATGVLVDEQDTSGTVTAVINLQDIVTKDQITDDSWYGHIQRDVNGSFIFTGKIILGDISGGGNTILRDNDKVMVWADNLVDADQYKLIIAEDTGTTEVTFGSEVGTGDDSRGVGGGFMTVFRDAFSATYSVKANDGSAVFNVFGMTFNSASGLILEQTGVQFVSSLISNSGQIVLSSGAEMREGFIVGSTEPSGVGAILLNANPVDPEFRDMQLINNVHAIESETNGPTTIDLRNIKFSGNTADVRFNHTSGLLTVNVLQGGDTPTTSDGGGGGTISIVASVSIDITVKDESGGAIENARVYIEDSGGTELLNTLTNASGIASTTFGGSTPEDVKLKIRKSSLGTRYKNFSKEDTITSSGLNLNITMAVDTNVSVGFGADDDLLIEQYQTDPGWTDFGAGSTFSNFQAVTAGNGGDDGSYVTFTGTADLWAEFEHRIISGHSGWDAGEILGGSGLFITSASLANARVLFGFINDSGILKIRTLYREDTGTTSTTHTIASITYQEDYDYSIIIHWSDGTGANGILEMWVTNPVDNKYVKIINESALDMDTLATCDAISTGSVDTAATVTYTINNDNYKVGTTGVGPS